MGNFPRGVSPPVESTEAATRREKPEGAAVRGITRTGK